MTDSPVRFALIGCGHMGATAEDRAAKWAEAAWWLPLSHAAAIQAVEGAELAAVCDVNPAAAAAAGARFQVPATYTDVPKMLASERPEAVAIATRTPERAAIIHACLDAGVRGIFCEKPLCQSLELADALASRMEEHGVAFIYGTRRRYMPIYREARAQIAAGRIGEPQAVFVRFGVGPLLWTHPHSVDIASFFASDAELAFAQADLALDPSCVQDQVIDCDPIVRTAYFQFQNGMTGHLLPSDSFDVEIVGSAGSVQVLANGMALEWRERRQPAGGRVEVGRGLESCREENRLTTSGTVQSIRELMSAVRGEPVALAPPTLAVRHLEALFAFVESHLADGCRVPLPLRRRGLTITGRLGSLFP